MKKTSQHENNTEIAQNLPGGLTRPTFQSEKKKFGVRKSWIPYFQAPKVDFYSMQKNEKVSDLKFFETEKSRNQ